MLNISCVVICYNNASFIKQAIESVLNQSMPVSEIIVADDGSSDDSREIILTLASKYEIIRPVFRDKNLGVVVNRDLAVRDVKSPLVTTLDGDDFFFKEKIECEYNALSVYKTEVAYSDIVIVDFESTPIKKISLESFAARNQIDVFKRIALRNMGLPRDMLFSKDSFLKAGGYNNALNIYEDWEFKLRLSAISENWSYSRTKGVAYRRTPNGLSSVGALKHFEAKMKVLRENSCLIKRIGGHRLLLRSYVNVFLSLLGPYSKEIFSFEKSQ